MLFRLKQWYSLEIYEKEEERRLAQIQLGFHLVYWIMTGILLLLDILWQDPILVLTLLAAGTFQIFSLWHLFKGRLNASAMLSVSVYIVAATVLAAIGQGTHDHSILIYPIAIMLAGLTNQRRGLFIATFLSLIGATGLFLAETVGWIPREHVFVSTWSNLVILASLILASTILTYYLIANADYGLTQTWRDLTERKKTESDLRDALNREQFLADIIRETSILVGVIGLDGSIQMVNKATIQQTGYSEAELLSLNWITNLTPEEWWGVENENLQRLSHSRTLVRYEKEFTRKDGSQFPVGLIVHPHLNASGNVDAYLSFATDITERKQIEANLRLSEERYRLLADDSPLAIIVSDLETGKMVYANQRAGNLFESPLSELLGSNAADHYVNTSDRESILQQLHEKHSITERELQLKKGNGQPFWASINANLSVFDNRLAIHVAIQDITRRKQAEEDLQESERRFRLLIDTAMDGIILMRLDGTVHSANPAALAILGYAGEEIRGIHRSQLVDVSDPRWERGIEQRDRTGTFRDELTGIRKDGSRFPMEVASVLINDPQKGLLASNFIRDITERKRMEEELRKSETDLRAIINATGDAVILQSTSHIILDLNDLAARMLDRPREELIGRNIFDLIPPQVAARHLPVLNRVVQTGESTSFEDERNGVWILNHIFPIKGLTGQVDRLVVYTSDITSAKQAEELLRKSEARYRAIVEDQSELICRFQPDGTLTFVNEAYCRYFGKSREELVGQSFNPLILEEDRLFVSGQYAKLTPVNPVATYEHRVKPEEGNLRWLQWTDRAIFDENDHIVEYASVGRDITELKDLQEQERELAALQERQRLARDLHDAVSQTLFSARLTSEMLLRQKDTLQPEILWRSIAHIADLIKSALGEMRILLLELRPEELAEAKLSALLSHLVDAAHGRIEAGIHSQIREECEPPQAVKIACYRIAQEALDNIIKHSNCTRIDITLECTPSILRLDVHDDGQGFPGGSGTGTQPDLRIMRERASEIGAQLEIISEPGTGTRVTCIWHPPGVPLP